jgi:hypothetical protein
VRDPTSTRFKPGVSGNPRGRPKGARNRLGEDFLEALQADFAEHGKATIEKVRNNYPQAYLKVIASIVPREISADDNALSTIGDDVLDAMIELLRDRIAPPASNDGGEFPDRS